MKVLWGRDFFAVEKNGLVQGKIRLGDIDLVSFPVVTTQDSNALHNTILIGKVQRVSCLYLLCLQRLANLYISTLGFPSILQPKTTLHEQILSYATSKTIDKFS